MNKLLLVDGSNLLFQMFFGMPARIVNSSGRAIQGTLGFVGALLKIIRMTSPTHIAVLFDGECKNARRELDSEYKANREDYSQVSEEENPFSQLPDIYAALDYLGICHAESTDCEVDDLVAAYVYRYRDEYSIVISSFDSDFFQLVDENVLVLRYRGENSVLCTSEYIKCRFGIQPAQYADFKALVGDPADNIKGVDKVGPKTAAALLNEHSTLEEILLSADGIKGRAVRESVKQSAEQLKTNIQLIKLGGEAALPFEVDELCYTPNSGITTTEVLRQIGVK